MFEIGIVGTKNAGKTTLIESLLPLFVKRGLRVGTIKHTAHNHSFDREGKDSYRHRAAGAVTTIAISQNELALFTGDVAMLNKMSARLLDDQCDICLVEGDKTSHRPKILLTRKFKESETMIPTNVLASYGSDSYSEIVSHFDPTEIELLVDFIIDKSKSGGGE